MALRSWWSCARPARSLVFVTMSSAMISWMFEAVLTTGFVIGQQPSERQAAVQLRTQHLGIDEEADHTLGFPARAVGVGYADADVALAGSPENGVDGEAGRQCLPVLCVHGRHQPVHDVACLSHYSLH